MVVWLVPSPRQTKNLISQAKTGAGIHQRQFLFRKAHRYHMITSSHIKLLAAFLVGTGTATAIMFMLTSSHTPARDQPGQNSLTQAPASIVSPSNPSASRTTSPASGSTSSDRSTKYASEPVGDAPSAPSSFSQAPKLPALSPNRSAFATSSSPMANSSQPSTGASQTQSTDPGSSPAYAPAGGAGQASTGPAAGPASYGANGSSYANSPTGGAGYTAPVQGTTSGTPSTGQTIEIGPEATIPASLAPANPAAKLTPEEQQLADDLGNQFLDTVGTAPPSDPATTDTWDKAQRQNDALYKLYFGYQAYNAQSAAAYRESLQAAGTSK